MRQGLFPVTSRSSGHADGREGILTRACSGSAPASSPGPEQCHQPPWRDGATALLGPLAEQPGGRCPLLLQRQTHPAGAPETVARRGRAGKKERVLVPFRADEFQRHAERAVTGRRAEEDEDLPVELDDRFVPQGNSSTAPGRPRAHALTSPCTPSAASRRGPTGPFLAVAFLTVRPRLRRRFPAPPPWRAGSPRAARRGTRRRRGASSPGAGSAA